LKASSFERRPSMMFGHTDECHRLSADHSSTSHCWRHGTTDIRLSLSSVRIW
jgi:hypothetical protein